jgi:hypothetical protein
MSDEKQKYLDECKKDVSTAYASVTDRYTRSAMISISLELLWERAQRESLRRMESTARKLPMEPIK